MVTARAAAAALVFISCCCCLWSLVAGATTSAATSGTITYGCVGGLKNDTAQWLSVSRGLFRGEVYQYWLSQSNAYLTHVQQNVVGLAWWPVPPTVTPVNGLVLSVNWTSYGFYQSLRVLLQDADNCFYDFDIPTLNYSAYSLRHKYCYDASYPLWQRIVPDDINSMDLVKNIYLVSLDYVAAISFDTIQPITIVKIPAGDFPMTSVVGASYQRNHGDDDQLFVIRSNNSPGQPSEILNYLVSSKQGVELRFGHVTYLEGQSNTLFTNDNSTQLLWTQVVPDWQNTGSKRGVLFDYSLQAPRFFRNGNLDFGSSPYSRWGTHAFSRVPGVEAIMITTTNQTRNSPGFTVHVAYLNETLSSLSFVDPLDVTDTVLPSLAQAIEFKDLWADFAVMMATHNAEGVVCLQLFIHCIGDLAFCYGTMPQVMQLPNQPNN